MKVKSIVSGIAVLGFSILSGAGAAHAAGGTSQVNCSAWQVGFYNQYDGVQIRSCEWINSNGDRAAQEEARVIYGDQNPVGLSLYVFLEDGGYHGPNAENRCMPQVLVGNVTSCMTSWVSSSSLVDHPITAGGEVRDQHGGDNGSSIALY
jgi:hypothetical protein